MENQIAPETTSFQSPTPQIENSEPIKIEAPKQNNFLVVLLSVLLIASVIIAGFFAYQTQTLVKELVLLKAVATSISEPTIEPTTKTIATPDPTANWKTYTNASSNYQVKYPSDWKVVNQSAGSMGMVVSESRYIEIGLGEGKSGTVGIEEIQMIPPSEEVNLTTTKIVGNLTLRCNGKFTTDTKTWCWVKVPNQEKYLNIQVFKNADDKMNAELDQILSTFKFTN